jgi:hypothetical protein
MNVASPAPNRRWFRYCLWTFGALSGFALLILGLGQVALTFWALTGTSRGPVDDRDQWPQPLVKLLAKAASEDIEVEPVTVYLVQDFTEHYYFCRVAASPELVALMSSEWELQPVSQADVDRFRNKWPTEWQEVDFDGPQRCLANKGHKSESYIVIVDEAKQVAYVFYYFNF